MLTEEHFELFKQFRIKAMGDKLREIINDQAYDHKTFEEKMVTLIEAEACARNDRKVAKLIKQAQFKTPAACIEEVLYLPERKLSKDRILRFAECDWVHECEVIIVISKTGCGKSFLVQALGNAACRKQIKTRYIRLAGICEELNRAKLSSTSSYYELMDTLKTIELLIIDDFMTTPITTKNAIELFEIMEARENRCATIIASQLEPNEWYLRIDGELIADSTLNRIATAARFIDLDGPNMREYFAKKKHTE